MHICFLTRTFLRMNLFHPSSRSSTSPGLPLPPPLRAPLFPALQLEPVCSAGPSVGPTAGLLSGLVARLVVGLVELPYAHVGRLPYTHEYRSTPRRYIRTPRD